jgi:2-polyprenyl-3-methyl-5-hydroxy-6-metoxy-1,4-benzoquinol methylase
MFNSTSYWVERYANGGTSGAGSTGRLNNFKSEFLNSIIEKYKIKSVLDFGCGQGAILEFLEIDNYLGFDPSKDAINTLKEKYLLDTSKVFEFNLQHLEMKELAISFDVIFHLIEDAVYEDYMRSLFSLSAQYVLIYSSNSNRTDPEYATAPHVKHRIFEEAVPIYFKLLEHHKNLFPYQANNPNETSWSEFFLYVRDIP